MWFPNRTLAGWLIIFVRSSIGSGKSSLIEIAAQWLSMNGFRVWTVTPLSPFDDHPQGVGLLNAATVLWTNGVAAEDDRVYGD